MTLEKRYGLLCRFLLNGMQARIDHFTGYHPFGPEMQAWEKIRKECAGATPGIEGEHIFDILAAGDKEPEGYAVIALVRIARVVPEVEKLLGCDVHNRFRQCEVQHIEELFKGQPGTYLLNYWGLRYEDNEHTIEPTVVSPA